MSFRDFNDEGPGTFEWDYVLGGNTTGLFPEETHYEVDGNTLFEVIFMHTGGNKFEPVYGDNWEIDNISEIQYVGGSRTFTFDQGTGHFRATVNEKLGFFMELYVQRKEKEATEEIYSVWREQAAGKR